MATQFFRRVFPKTLIYSRSLSTTSSPITFLRPLSAAVITSPRILFPPSFHSRATIEPSPNAIALKLRNGCDYKRRLVIMNSTYIDRFIGLFRGEPTKDQIMDSYVKKLAKLVGSEDEARMMVYSGSKLYKHSYAFGTLLSDEIADRINALPGHVMLLLADPFEMAERCFRDSPNKGYVEQSGAGQMPSCGQARHETHESVISRWSRARTGLAK
ncbi:plastid developmental protein DAG, partial [Trifolium medium]|nr:plastid developmental protein DAG [Trifolium medium]